VAQTDNPASAAIFRHIFPTGNGATTPHATLDYKDVPDFMTKLRKVENSMTALALEMIILCAARPGPARFWACAGQRSALTTLCGRSRPIK
jgi:hypothetical protein